MDTTSSKTDDRWSNPESEFFSERRPGLAILAVLGLYAAGAYLVHIGVNRIGRNISEHDYALVANAARQTTDKISAVPTSSEVDRQLGAEIAAFCQPRFVNCPADGSVLYKFNAITDATEAAIVKLDHDPRKDLRKAFQQLTLKMQVTLGALPAPMEYKAITPR